MMGVPTHRSRQFRFAAFGILRRAGVTADSATEVAELPGLEHTGLEPVTVSEQELPATNGNGRG